MRATLPRHRFLRQTALGALLMIVAAVVATWLLLRASLPRYDGDIAGAPVSDPVVVERDALGTATLRAATRDDLDWALGYVHAQERYFEMDLLRRRAAGELAELFGAVALPADRTARPHRMRTRLRQSLAHATPAQLRILDRYVAGVNAGLRDLTARPFPYLLTQTVPAPWQREDVLLVIAAMAFSLNDAGNRRELAFERMHAALPASAYRFITAAGGEWDTPLQGSAWVLPELPGADELDLRALAPASTEPASIAAPKMPGSNSFAVAGELAGGSALVANDMHLDLRVPSLWFRARFVYADEHGAGVDITGATLPGTPAMIVGSNGHVAWGFTNSYIDTTDWIRVERDPADPSRYRTMDGWTSISRHDETLRVHGGDDERLAVEETEWGPILATDSDGAPLALAWTAHREGAFNLALMQLESARDAEEAVRLAQASGLPPQNFLVGDRDGRIAWTLAGRIPKRSGGYDATLPADWSQPGTGWDGWLDAKDYPSVIAPADGRLWTANQRVADSVQVAILGDGGYDLGARAGQIRDDLRALTHFGAADMLAIQLDDRALLLQRWKDQLQAELSQAPPSPEIDRLRHALADWNGHAAIDSVAYRLVRAWRNEVIDRTMDGFAAVVRQRFADFALPKLPQSEHVVWKLLDERPAHLLPPGHKDWNDFLLWCALAAGGKLDGQPGGLAARTWGERNTARIAHPLSRALPGWLARQLDMPADELPGDSNLPRVQAPDFGASERFAVAPGDEENGYFMMPGGQSGHPLSPYYGAGHSDWVQGTPTPFLPGPAHQVLRFLPR